MKLKGVLIGLICLVNMNVFADTFDRMKQLPAEIVIDAKDDTLNFKKGSRSDSFFVTQNEGVADTYRQTYHSELCFASVTHQPAQVGRMSNAKVKRYIKDITHFQITRQDSFKVGSDRFFMNVESVPEQTTVLLVAGQKESFIKIDVTCQIMPDLKQRSNEKTAIYFAKKIAESVMPFLNEKNVSQALKNDSQSSVQSDTQTEGK